MHLLVLIPVLTSVVAYAHAQRDIFAFHAHDPPDVRSAWQQYPWNRIATVAVFTHDTDVQKKARQEGALYVMAVGFPKDHHFTNITWRKKWVDEQVQTWMVGAGVDGLNIDFESDVAKGSLDVNGLTAAVEELKAAMQKVNPKSELSFDSAIRPGYEGRFYDLAGISAACDHLFVMAYDMNDFDDAPPDNDHTYANSALRVVEDGLHALAAAGVPMGKVTLGLPWYGYAYQTIGTKHITGDEVAQRDFAKFLRNGSEWTKEWDDDSQTPFIRKGNRLIGQELWYDDPRSLLLKAHLAGSMGVGQLGMWEANSVDYIGDPKLAQSYWDALMLKPTAIV